MHHLSRALATARIDDLHRDAAQRATIRLARGVTQEQRTEMHAPSPPPSRRDRLMMHQEMRTERS